VGPGDLITQTSTVTAITTPIAVLLWAVGVILFLGLPDYYRQDPGQVPSFYTSVMRRKIVLVSLRPLQLPQGFPSDSCIVVLRHGTHPKLLAVCPLWSQLEIPLVQPSRSGLVYCNPYDHLLRRGMGALALYPLVS
jgi:fumarate reductase subunit D